ncbi:DUF3617 family protein (plasmid) [Polymorphobacter megasporae]|nr:DUF3617 family protein [Polymorphobacter megasporae]
MIGYADRQETWSYRRSSGNVEHFKSSAAHAVSDSIALEAMLIAGGGLGRLPDFIARRAVATGDLMWLFPETTGDTLEGHALYTSHRSLSAKVRAFIDALIGHLSGGQGCEGSFVVSPLARILMKLRGLWETDRFQATRSRKLTSVKPAVVEKTHDPTCRLWYTALNFGCSFSSDVAGHDTSLRVEIIMRRITPLVVLLPVLLAAASAPVPMPGLWEHTVVYVIDEVNGSSFIADQAQSVLPSPPPYRACYSASDLADPRSFLLASNAVQCRFSRVAMADGNITAAGECKDSRYPALRVDGSGTYGANGYDFSFAGEAQSGDMTVSFRGRDSGRRVGSCPAGGTGR